ncbi:SAM-dependent methyltransferase [Sphingomonas bacterium]|uniref:SAM-dependent methyltransferase n=1 Tax=Sphingomonas bacterium TaxID=1895847 RepID=UPI001576243C|nr:methyltransferase domain-containing protein [Sphingomonas bacterium]
MFGKYGASTAYSLDPFAFWPEAKSSIAGLGGSIAPVDAKAAFHTNYTSFDPGPLTIDLIFAQLKATRGTLTLYAMASPEDGGPAKVQSRLLIDLAELAAAGGRHRLPIMVKQGYAYAFLGRILDDTDASASALTLQTDQHVDGPAFARKLAAAKAIIFGPRGSSSGLVVDGPATLADVRSQMCTAAQFDEPDYDRWLALMHRPKHQHRKQWEYVWICRVLETMGSLMEGARGLGFGCGIEPLPALFAAYGAFVTATDLGAEDRRAKRWQASAQHLLSVDALSDSAVCPSEQFFQRVEVDAIDMNAVPDNRTGYDFCWSSCSLEHLGSIDAGLRFIERSLDTLKPGGVAVHTTEFNLTSDTRTIRKGGTVLFRRSDIENFARKMASAGHEVLPITFDQGDQPEDQVVDMPPYAADVHFKLALGSYVTTSFGLAIRKRR